MTSVPPDGPGPLPPGRRRLGWLLGHRAWAAGAVALALVGGASALTVHWQNSSAIADRAAASQTADVPRESTASTTPPLASTTQTPTPTRPSPTPTTTASPTTTTPTTPTTTAPAATAPAATTPVTTAPRTTAPRPPTTTRTTAPAPPPVTKTTAPPATTPVLEVLRLTNVERAKAGCAALRWNAALASAAQAHSTDMRDHNYFDHNSLDGQTPFDRMKAAGYTYRMAAENIAAGQPTAAAVVAAWMGSAGHRANILNCGLKDLGVGYAAGGSSRYYWTQDFGTPL